MQRHPLRHRAAVMQATLWNPQFPAMHCQSRQQSQWKSRTLFPSTCILSETSGCVSTCCSVGWVSPQVASEGASVIVMSEACVDGVRVSQSPSGSTDVTWLLSLVVFFFFLSAGFPIGSPKSVDCRVGSFLSLPLPANGSSRDNKVLDNDGATNNIRLPASDSEASTLSKKLSLF